MIELILIPMQPVAVVLGEASVSTPVVDVLPLTVWLTRPFQEAETVAPLTVFGFDPTGRAYSRRAIVELMNYLESIQSQ